MLYLRNNRIYFDLIQEYYEDVAGEGYDTYYQIEKGEYEELKSLENQFGD